MVVNSYNVEFGYELISALPYAYYLHSIGQLEKTISGNDTECLYYFSPKHEINKEVRSWYNTPKAVKIPNIDIHKPYLNKEQFLAPPLKKHYANKRFKFKKETIVICNRHNIEWGKKPINYFNLTVLREMFKLLQGNYQIVYINIDGLPELYDNAPPIKLGDYELLKKYPGVINIHDLHRKNKDLSFNELQLMIFANCSKFITMNGGHSILASYFGGDNIIMSKHGTPETREINPAINSFYRWYNEFGGSRIRHVVNENKLIEAIRTQWIEKEPVINILVRTSGRVNYFKRCIESIRRQTYTNVNVFCCIDFCDVKSKYDYTVKYPVYTIAVKKYTHVDDAPKKEMYGKKFPYNLYFNTLHEKVKEGVIMYLDDDDILHSPDTLKMIAREFKRGGDLVFWKVKSGERVIPSKKNFGKAPVCCDISGIGFAFNSKYKKYAEWEPYKRGDYRIATKLYNKIKKIKFIDAILTSTQNGQHSGSNSDYKFPISVNSGDWYIRSDGKYWFGDSSVVKKRIASGEMRKVKIEDVPEEFKK